MKKLKVFFGFASFLLVLGIFAPMAFASPAPPLTSFQFYAGESDGNLSWDYYYPYGDPTAHVAVQPMVGTTGYFALFENGYGNDSTIHLSYLGNNLNITTAADDTPLTDSGNVVWGWIVYRGFALNQVTQNASDEFIASCTSLVFPYNTYSDYINVEVNPATSPSKESKPAFATSVSPNGEALADTYNLLSFAANARLERSHSGSNSKQPTVTYHQFASLMNHNQVVRNEASQSDVPSYLTLAANLIGDKYGNSVGTRVLSNLKQAYRLGLVDSNGRLMTQAELNH